MVTVGTGIVIFAHGSSVAAANRAVEEVAHAAAAEGGFEAEVAFLEARPSLDEVVARLVGRGMQRILVVPYFLTLGIHLQRDLPVMVEEAARRHDGIEIRVTPPLDGHPGLQQIVVERARQGLENWG